MATTEISTAAGGSLRVCNLNDAPDGALQALLARQATVSRARFGPPLGAAVERLSAALSSRGVEGYYAESREGEGYVAVARFPDADVVGALWTTPGGAELAPALLAPVRERCLRERRRLEAQDLTFGEWPPAPDLSWMFTFSRERLYLRAETGLRPAVSTSGRGVTLREMRDGDLLSCAAVATRAFATSPDAELSRSYGSLAANGERLSLAFQGDSWGARVPTGSVVAATDDGRIVGFVFVTALGPELAHLFEMAVVPEARGRGVGADLLAYALRECARRGLRQITLSVTSSNDAARRLYDRFGFTAETVFHAHVLEAGNDGAPARPILPGKGGGGLAPPLKTRPVGPAGWHPTC